MASTSAHAIDGGRAPKRTKCFYASTTSRGAGDGCCARAAGPTDTVIQGFGGDQDASAGTATFDDRGANCCCPYLRGIRSRAGAG